MTMTTEEDLLNSVVVGVKSLFLRLFSVRVPIIMTVQRYNRRFYDIGRLVNIFWNIIYLYTYNMEKKKEKTNEKRWNLCILIGTRTESSRAINAIYIMAAYIGT